MSNHSEHPFDSPIPEAIAKAFHEPLIGATGLDPAKKLTPHDEGSIQFAVGVKDGKVCVDFGTPVKWLGMEPGQALELAQSLIQHARNAARGTGSILTLNL
jgi:hypothetical protein